MVRESGGLAGRRLLRLGLLATYVGALATSPIHTAAGAEDHRGPIDQAAALSGLAAVTYDAAEASAEQVGPERLPIKFTAIHIDGTGAAPPRRFSCSLTGLPTDAGRSVVRLIAIPDCDGASVQALTFSGPGGARRFSDGDAARLVSVDDIVRIRDQAIAVVRFDLDAIRRVQDPAEPWTEVALDLSTIRGGGPVCKNTGPFTHACGRGLVNYRAEPAWVPPTERGERGGGVTYCHSVADCEAARLDVLWIVAEDLASAGSLFGFAVHHALYLGLNVGIVNVGDLAELTPEAIHGFIQDVYDTGSAGHFGDGHLGFVLLIGDAYADDNETVMLPAYDGYGGTEVASDHYYACVSGDDDFEDVMIGRFSVGNTSELSAITGKVANYLPQDPLEDWYERVLLVAGMFYTIKDDYVALFDEYEELLPDDVNADRIYRHDFSSNEQCAQAVVAAFNDGYLFIDYAGDGWKFTWEYTMDTSHVPLIQNADRLPIVFSMACMTGWFDNTSDADAGGSYDCLAEQLVNSPTGGAIACLAASRSSDGGIYRTITKKLYRAAFEENCVFLGETVVVAKLLHLQDGDDVDYVRHFNLFGDPALIFASDTPPNGQPDLVVRPHDVEWSTELPGVGQEVTITVPVRNQSQEAAENVTVRVSRLSGGPTYDVEDLIPSIDAWSVETTELEVPMPEIGDYTIEIQIDPDDEIPEICEDNNSFARPLYAYPHLAGFPVDIGASANGPCTAHLSGSGNHVLVSDEDARLIAFADDGTIAWQTPSGAPPLMFDREVAPAVGDLDGDGTREVVFTRRGALVAVAADGDELWSAAMQDPLGYPVVADADGDGDLDAVVSTVGVFGAPCEIVAIDEDGQEIWTHQLDASEDVSTCPVAGDFDLDGHVDIAYGTTGGRVAAVSCAQNPPVALWGPFDLATSEIAALALGDVDGDGLLELVVADDTVTCLNAEDGSDAGWNVPVGPGVVTLALADFDGDDVAEVIAGTSAGQLCLIAAGTVVWSVPLSGTPTASASIADIDGDGCLEILVGTEAGYVHVLTEQGEDRVPPVPVLGAANTPFVGNLLGDERREVVVSSSVGVLFAFGFEAAGSSSACDWAGIGRSARRGGVHVQPLAGTFATDAILAGHYRATGDVVVEPTATLAVASESILEFESDPPVRLEIRGALEAAGHPGGEIVMTAGGSGARSAWRGLVLGPGAVADLSFCRVSGAAVGIDANAATLNLNECEITENGTGARLHGCTVDATTSAFSQSDSVGMYIDGGTGSIVGCEFDLNGAAGVECREADSHEFRACSFTGGVHGDGARLTRYSDVFIDSCTFDQNARHGLSVKTSAPTIRSSSFSGNGMYGVYCMRLADPDVRWSTIAGNAIGVVAEAGSAPNLGNDMHPESGYNSIMNNQTAAIANYVSSHVPVYARRNWWGTPTPLGRVFIGYVAYTPWLTEPPDPAMYDVSAEALPTSYELLQNTPNPFNPTTTITYRAPAGAGRVEIAVYDVAGRRLATLLSSESSPGTHQIVWDGLDDDGNRVASGTYFVRMSAPGHSSTQKMTLLK